MTRPICLAVCEIYLAEVNAALARLQASRRIGQVSVVSFPARRHHPADPPYALPLARFQAETGCEEIHVLGGGGLPDGDSGSLPAGLHVHRHGDFLRFLLNPDLIRYMVRRGDYLLTPGRLAHGQTSLSRQGLDGPRAGHTGPVRSLVLLDTGVDPHSEEKLQAFAGDVGLPYEILPVGLEHLVLKLGEILSGALDAERALAESEERFRSLYDSSLSALALHEVLCDDGGRPIDYRFLDLNPAFEAMTGLQRSEVLGKTVREVLPGVEQFWIDRYGRVALTGEPTHFEAASQPLGRHYEVVAFSPRRGQFAVSFTDITQRKLADAEQARLMRALRMVSNCNQVLVRAARYEPLFAEVCKIIVHDGGYGLAWVAIDRPPDEQTPPIQAVAGAGPVALGGMDSAGLAALRQLRQIAARGSKPVILRDATLDPDLAGALSTLGAGPVAAVALLPLRAGGDSLGVLGICSDDVAAFDAAELPLLAELAGDVAFGVSTMQAGAARDLAEAVLRESEARYRDLVEMSPSAIFIFIEGRFAYVNRATVSLLGASSPADLVGRNVLDFIHPDSRELVRDRITRLRDERLPVPLLEEKYLRLDGGVVDVAVIAGPIVYQGRPAAHVIVHDISDRRRAETALAQTEALFRRVIEQSSDGIMLADERGKIIAWNPALEQITGLADDAALGRYLWDVIDRLLPDSRPGAGLRRKWLDHPDSFLPERQAEGLDRVVELVMQRPDGAHRIVQTAVYSIPTAQGAILASIGRDITDLKQREEALMQQQKMESIGLLAGGIAHDFNNLLTSVLAQVTLAAGQLYAAHPALSHLEKAVRSAERATDLTRQLLAYAGKGRALLGALDLNTLIRDNLGLLETVLPKQARLHLALDSALPLTVVDRAQLQQVLMNLAINAAEALPGGVGDVTVRTYPCTVTAGDDLSQFVNTARPEPGDYVCLEVSDTGRGIDPLTLKRIFDPFFSTKGTGRGLGLSAMLGIVRSHQGALSVSSEPEYGSVFRVYLPAQATERHAVPPAGPAAWQPPAPVEDPRPGAEDSNPGASPAEDAPLVLVIDDEQPVREALVDILELAGFRVITAADGQEGYALFLEHHAEVRVVVLDLVMPVLSGEETFRLLRAADPVVKVILSSGYDETEAERRLRERQIGHGPDDFVAKPYDIQTIVKKVRRLA